MTREVRSKQIKLKVLLSVIWIVFLSALVVFGVYTFKKRKTIGQDLGFTSKYAYDTNINQDVNALVITYLNALATADQQTLKSCVTNPSQYDNMATVESRSKIITGYNNVNVYSLPGVNEDEYLVYAVANISIANISSQPLDIVPKLYIVKRNGNYLINNEVPETDVADLESQADASADIQELYSMVKTDEEEKAAQDPAFKEFLEKLK